MRPVIVQSHVRRRAVSLAAFMAAVLMVGVQGWAQQLAQPRTEELKIGAAISLTGRFFREGSLVKRGYDLWAASVNDRGGFRVADKTYTIQLIYHDDQSDTNTATKLADKLITEDKVNFIFGPFGSALSLAVSAITERHQVVMVAPAGNADALFEQGHKYFFGLIAPASTLINPFVDMLNKTKEPPRSIAIVSKDELFGQTQRKGLMTYLAKVGNPRSVFNQPYPVDAIDFSTVITQVKRVKPDVVVQTGHQQDCSTFFRQMRDLGLQPKAYFCSGPDMRDFYGILGDLAAHSFGYALGWDPSVRWCDDVIGCARDYSTKYQAKFSDQISYQAVNASAAGIVLMKAILAARSIDSTPVRDALRKLKITVGGGPVQFDETGRNVAASSAIQQVLPKGDVVLVWPQERRQKDPVYPMPAFGK